MKIANKSGLNMFFHLIHASVDQTYTKNGQDNNDSLQDTSKRVRGWEWIKGITKIYVRKIDPIFNV